MKERRKTKPPRGRPPTLDPDSAARVREVLERLLTDRFDGVQARLADAIGVSKGSVGDYLLGRGSPSFPTLRRIAALVGTSVDGLLAA